jgi:putative transposase
MMSKPSKYRRKLAKSIANASWSGFTTKLEYKAESAGILVKKVNPAYTTQTCSDCGIIKKKMLEERIHNCPCGLIIDRDINAALNILKLGQEMPEVKPVERKASTSRFRRKASLFKEAGTIPLSASA